MPCKKTDLISAINSFGAAKASGDNTLLAFSVNLVQSLIDTLDFEGEIEVTTAEVEDKSKTKKQVKE
jgi:hypothetical protein